MDRLKQQLAFILEIDKLKKIGRQTYLSDKSRKENDAEHSWHLAIMAVLLQEYANEKIDTVKVITMVLAHDLVEIDAGDTFAYDEEGNKTKRQREEKAADRIFGLLPEEQAEYFRNLWEEFEAYETPEAKFAHMLDNFQPLLLNDAVDGDGWREKQIRLSQIYKRNEKTAEGSREIWEYMKVLLDKNVEKGSIIRDNK